LEVVQGCSGTVYADWLAARRQPWRQQIRVAALDPFRGYLNALRASSCPPPRMCWMPSMSPRWG
jgi:hypothetical protein